jgi:hypothetical protein
LRNASVGPDGEINVGSSVAHMVLMERGVSGVRQDLVDAASEHHVSA